MQLKGECSLHLLTLISSVTRPARDARVRPATSPIAFLPSKGCALVPGRPVLLPAPSSSWLSSRQTHVRSRDVCPLHVSVWPLVLHSPHNLNKALAVIQPLESPLNRSHALCRGEMVFLVTCFIPGNATLTGLKTFKMAVLKHENLLF